MIHPATREKEWPAGPGSVGAAMLGLPAIVTPTDIYEWIPASHFAATPVVSVTPRLR